MRKGKLTSGVFRILLNICDGVFQKKKKKWGTAKSCLIRSLRMMSIFVIIEFTANISNAVI